MFNVTTIKVARDLPRHRTSRTKAATSDWDKLCIGGGVWVFSTNGPVQM